MNPSKKHYTNTKKFFQADLKIYNDYNENLNAWRNSYIKRIEEEFLGKNIKGKTLTDIGTYGRFFGR